MSERWETRLPGHSSLGGTRSPIYAMLAPPPPTPFIRLNSAVNQTLTYAARRPARRVAGKELSGAIPLSSISDNVATSDGERGAPPWIGTAWDADYADRIVSTREFEGIKAAYR